MIIQSPARCFGFAISRFANRPLWPAALAAGIVASSFACSDALDLKAPTRAEECQSACCKEPCEPAREQEPNVADATPTEGDASLDAVIPSDAASTKCDREGAIDTKMCGAKGAYQFRQCSQGSYGGWSACAADGFRPMSPPPAGFVERALFASTVAGDELLVWGGQNSALEPLGDGAAYNFITDTWRMLPVAPMAARSHMTSLWTGSTWVIYGGRLKGSLPNIPLAEDGAFYDPKVNAWTKVSLMLGPRDGMLAVWEENASKAIFWGGLPKVNLGAQTGLSDGRYWIEKLNARSAMPSSPAAWGRSAQGFWENQKMFVFLGAGCNNAPCTDAVVFETFYDRWQALKNPLPGIFKDGGVSRFTVTKRPAGGAVLFGGSTRDNKASHEGYVFNSASETFARLPDLADADTPKAKDRVAFFCGARFGVYGGALTTSLTDTGALLTRDGLSWEALPTGGPSPRLATSAGSRGLEVALWGGRGDGGMSFVHYADGKVFRSRSCLP
jgi:hypothetical protein